ncbi:MAG: phosphomannomutase/phosphoglucomutase [Pseudomonadota bacterium]
MHAHSFDHTVLREYDIRGIVGKTLSAEDARAVGRSLGTVIRRSGGGKVAVGRDGRLSSPELAQAVIDGLTDTGIDVLSVGTGPTPMLYFSVFELDLDGGVMITGSHNPPEYNGFKMMLGKKPCFGEAIQDLGRIAAAGDYESGRGSAQEVAIFDRYIERLLEDFDGAALNVAWDPGNGAAGEATKALIDKLPGRHVIINGDIDGTFPNHHPDPTVEKNLVQLKDVVAKEGLDLGIAFDGDGDRIGAIDAHGRVIWGDQLISILAKDVLAELPGSTIIADVKASQALFDSITEMGGKPLMWKTGHSLIKNKMAEVKSPLAGEMSGHIFFAHKFYGYDDALYVALRFLNAVANQGGDLGKIRDAMPAVVNTPELRFPCDETRKFAVIDEVVARLKASDADINDIDGARVNTPYGWWLLRASNTQDVLVARCEAQSGDALENLKGLVKEQLQQSGLDPALLDA